MLSTIAPRTQQSRIIAGIIVVFFFLIILHNNVEPSNIPSMPRRMRYSSLKERMLFSDKAWQKSVDLRNQNIKIHPKYPQIPLFPAHTDPGSKNPVWDYYTPSWQCPLDVQRVGRFGDGGKWMCGMNLYESIPPPKAWSKPEAKIPAGGQDGLVMYSFGVHDDSSFEAEMLERAPSLRVWGYDFSVDNWGPQIPLKYLSRAFFNKVGLGETDKPNENPPFYTFQSLMERNNHTYIDILKIDVEGAEYKALSAFMDHLEAAYEGEDKPVMPIGQILIELHLGPYAKDMDFFKFDTWWKRLEQLGMRPTWIELNLLPVVTSTGKRNPDCTEYVLVNPKAKNNVLWKE